MIRPLLAAALAGAFAFAAHAAPAANPPQSLLLIANGETAGYLKAAANGDTYEVDYHVDNNGRGPKHHETIVLGEHALPLAWSVTGTSLMGGQVAERYRWHDGVAEWNSQADSGRSAQPHPMLYITNDSSPWAMWTYAKALLAAPGHRLDVLPSGRMQLELVGTLALPGQAGAPPLQARLLRLSGLDLEPHYLAVDADGALLADLDDDAVAIRDGYQAQLATLTDAVKAQQFAHAQVLQRQLAHPLTHGLWLRNVHVFDPINGLRSDAVNIHVADGHIVSVDAQWQPAPGDRVYDGGGGTVIPGLHDMHSHSTLSSGLWYLAAGVTNTRDMGNDNAFLLDLTARIERGEIAGPRIVRNGFLEGRSPYSARNGFVVDRLDDALKDVAWYKDHGYWQIKLYNSMNPAWVAPIAARAHALGMGVTGHVPAFTNADAMIAAGYDEITHINQLMLGWVLAPGEDTRTPLRLTAMKRVADLDLDAPQVRRTLELMRQRDIALDTTDVILERLMLSRAGSVLPADAPYLSHMPIAYQRYRQRTFVPDLTPQTDAQYRQALDKTLQLIGRLHRQGTVLLPGTDDTTGFTVHRELELYVAAGLSPQQALRAGTWQSELHFGRTDRLGSVHPGKQADFVLLPGDPTTDIAAIRQPALVVKDRQLYLPAEIYRALGVEPFAPPPKTLQ
ncbi:amidohydrolase family protein [Xanthomonas bundabergensis]|uniref:amidohydrolase family protein n=1 Tax=Xanthomonas bundabergensis TaxID=3160842 RepID=UPI0035170310